ncbi:hypothetical protein [Lysobacter antibioticus]|uniref:hypothetical protein n=1 Tax=Lysobacter antibioticus TaxID=84531 RepID=UPI0007E8E781|nr:hypothetical protein [Lysobacter antibioticus]
MKTPLPLTLAGCFLFALTACSNAVLDPKYERNPNPRQKRVVTATIDGAPGSFAEATASVQYIIGPERTCMPSAEPFSGTFPTPERFSISIPMRKLSDTTYEFDIYLDGMLAKDYFGKGVCTWVVELASIYLQPTRDENGREFLISLQPPELASRKRTVFYARRDAYSAPLIHATHNVEYTTSKENFITRYGTDLSKAFTITVDAKE